MPYAYKRLNIINGAPVNEHFFNSMTCVGVYDYEFLKTVYTPDEWSAVKWYFEHAQLNPSDQIFVFRVRINHHLKRGHRNSFHNETWLFALISVGNFQHVLCPLKRDGDVDAEIFDSFSNAPQKELQGVWKRHSCTL